MYVKFKGKPWCEANETDKGKYFAAMDVEHPEIDRPFLPAMRCVVHSGMETIVLTALKYVFPDAEIEIVNGDCPLFNSQKLRRIKYEGKTFN